MEFWKLTNQRTNTKEKTLTLGPPENTPIKGPICGCGKKAVEEEAKASQVKTKHKNLYLESILKTLKNVLTL